MYIRIFTVWIYIVDIRTARICAQCGPICSTNIYMYMHSVDITYYVRTCRVNIHISTVNICTELEISRLEYDQWLMAKSDFVCTFVHVLMCVHTHLHLLHTPVDSGTRVPHSRSL